MDILFQVADTYTNIHVSNNTYVHYIKQNFVFTETRCLETGASLVE